MLRTSSLPPEVFRSCDQLLLAFPDHGTRGLGRPGHDELVWSGLCSAPSSVSVVAVGDARRFCLGRLASWSRAFGPALAFKVGIAADPEHRYFNAEFGYAKEQVWMFMDVVWEVDPMQR